MRLNTCLPWLCALWLIPAALPLLPCVPAGPVRAQPDSDQLARTRFEQGREAYKDGRYRDAWAYFHEAYQLSGRPELLFNIGQTADRLGQEEDALRAFNMYLEQLPNAENRRDVENRVRALRERVANAPKTPPAPQAAPLATPVQPASPQPSAAPARPDPRARRERREREHRAAAAPAPAPAPATPAEGREIRRGLYLRAAVGLGPRTDSISHSYDPEGELEVTLSGWGPALDVAAGWAVAPGFVVGGGLFLDWVSSPTYSVAIEDASGESTLEHFRLTSFGPFIDWYPKRTTLGLHIEGGFGLGLAGFAGDLLNTTANRSAVGFTFFLGAGYEWRIAGPFAIGALLRLTGAALSNDEQTHGLFSPSLLVSFTWF